MALGSKNQPADRRGFRRCSLLLLLCLGSAGLRADIISDLLIVVQADGRHYIAQQTLTTDTALVAARLPAQRISLETRFAGSERLTFTRAHELNPDQVSLWSGSAWTRYRHQYGQGLKEHAPGVFELDTGTEHPVVQIDAPGDTQWSVTWILPDDARLSDFRAADADADADNDYPGGSWQTSGQVVTFRQSGGVLPSLHIRYALHDAEHRGTDGCLDGLRSGDQCAPDSDGDTVPDSRDICLPPSSRVAALLPPGPSVLQKDPVAEQAPIQADILGCAHEDPLVLSGIHFQSGQYYLNVASRQVLDRVARALQQVPDQNFEISSHTDNAGRVDINQRLSLNRAKAVRHYLLLRGVDAGQLRARGYGESAPVYDNAEAIGRRANRRTELRRRD